MLIDAIHTRTLWVADNGWDVNIIDQTRLPHALDIVCLQNLTQATDAIRQMQVRGAPLIGVTAAYGVALALREDASDAALNTALAQLQATRPTAINLAWALAQMRDLLFPLAPQERVAAAYREAAALAEDDVALNRRIGAQGLALIRELHGTKGEASDTVNIMTHCNAGWLATVDYGTALAPIYRAHEAGVQVHVWVSETRPRNQGAALTAWELSQQGVPHTVIADNAAGHLLQTGRVDMIIVGSDRTSANGDVCNKIGTYLKALAARDNGVPFYVALPGSTIDWSLARGEDIPIEERSAAEVTAIQGQTAAGDLLEVHLTPPASPAANPGFDVTPARLVSGLITERGVCDASREGLLGLYPERAPA